MKARATPLQIYRFLDKSNCKLCGKESCLEFATDVLERRIDLDACQHLQKQDQSENYHHIKTLLLPPQKQVIFGSSARQCVIGGEEVLYRHERTFYNPTAIAVEISDNFTNWDTFEKTIAYLTTLTITRIGEDLKLDAVAIRYVSQNPDHYMQTIQKILEISDLPLILCCMDPLVVEKILQKHSDCRPLIYAATPTNGEKYAHLARKFNVPLACFSSDLASLASLLTSIEKFGVEDIVIDSGTFFSSGGKNLTLNRIQEIRHQIFEQKKIEFGYPIIGIPATIWAQNPVIEESTKNELSSLLQITPEIQKIFDEQTQVSSRLWKRQYEEVLMGILLQTIDTNLIITHVGQNPDEIWGLMALMTYRQNIFTDPRIYPRVDSGLILINSPNEWSPVYITSNYRMTKIPVEQDLIDAKLDGYLVVVDTEGIGIESATAGGQFNEDRIKKTFEECSLFAKIRHRVVILPGMAARLKAPLENLAHCEVWVGPRDSSSISSFLEDNWNYEEIKAKYSQP